MRLLIISHTPHYLRDGQVIGWGATVREIDQLATLFDSVVHIAPLYDEPAPGSAMGYESSRVRFRPVTPAGGQSLAQKLLIPLRYPGYARAILQERRHTDVIHVRAPANISLLALVLLSVLRRPKLRWAKYAGDWSGGDSEPWSYRLQRYWLRKRFHKGLVTVNGNWPNQPSFIASFPNPCLTQGELEEGHRAAGSKALREPVRLLFVGRLESAKGVGICLEVLQQLNLAGVKASLDLIGDGAERNEFEQHVRQLDIGGKVTFHGGLPRTVLGDYFSRSHFILLPSACSEGWPKVLSEAMAYGAVPLASAVGSIPEYLEKFSVGLAIASLDSTAFSAAIKDYLHDQPRWLKESATATEAAQTFSYASYLDRVRELLTLPPSQARTQC